ncbi:MAG: YCF48-related protein [Saprospiraceae bacterium]
MRTYISFLFTLILFSSCEKEKVNYPWQEINIPSDYDLTDIHFINNTEGFISSGETWEHGEILNTTDGGISWSNTVLSDFIIKGLDSDRDGTIQSCGHVGYYSKNFPYSNHTLPTYHQYDDLAVKPDGSQTVLIAGQAFNYSHITLLDENVQVISVDSFDRDMEVITYIDDNTIMACGSGLVIRSEDNGNTWNPLSLTGEFFKGISFPTETTGYMCGFGGSILKSTDGGQNWDYLRNGDKLLVSDKRFTALDFEDENHGYVVGLNGLCWRTIDGGNSWKIIKGLKDYDFTGVHVMQNKAFLIAFDGKLIEIIHS